MLLKKIHIQSKTTQRVISIARGVLLSKSVLVFFALLFFYALVGFFLVPFVLERSIPDLAKKRINLQASLSEIRVNPFDLTLEATGVKIEDQEAKPLGEMRRLFVDLEWKSILHRSWVFHEISMDTPSINVMIEPDGTLNVNKMISGTQGAESSEQIILPPLLLENLSIKHARLNITDTRGVSPETFEVRSIDLQCNSLSTLSGSTGTYTLNAVLSGGEAVHGEGDISLAPLKSKGKVNFEKIETATLWPFMREHFNMHPPRGQIDMIGSYLVDGSKTPSRLEISDLQIELSNASFQLMDAEKPFMALKKVQVSGTRFDLSAHTVDVGKVSFQSGSLALLTDAGGNLNLQHLIKSLPGPNDKKKPASARKSSSLSPAGAPRPWRFRFNDIEIQNLGLMYRDKSRKPSVHAQIADTQVQCGAEIETGGKETNVFLHGLKVFLKEVQGGSLDDRDSSLRMEKVHLEGGEFELARKSFTALRIGIEGGSVEVFRDKEGNINWTRFLTSKEKAITERDVEKAAKEESQWRFASEAITLSRFAINFSDHSVQPHHAQLNLEGLSLKLTNVSPKDTMDFELTFKMRQGGDFACRGNFNPAVPSFQTSIQVLGLAMVPFQPYLNSFVKLKIQNGNISTQGTLNYKGSQNEPDLKYQGQIQSENLLLMESDSGAPFFGWEELKSSDLRLMINPDSLEIGELKLSKPFGKLVIEPNRTVNVTRMFRQSKTSDETKSSESMVSSKEKDRSFAVRVNTLRIVNGILDFADLSLKPQFASKIHQLNGVISGLSSTRQSRAQVLLDGNVDKYGMARIDGKINLFDPKQFTDIRMIFRNVEMTRLTPYSGKFAGRKINSGKLSLDLNYKIKESKLLGDNKIIVDQLVLGQRVESPDAVNLPLDFAVALLQDSNGRINIGLPIRGDLNDPQFNYGHLLWKGILNLFNKIVTSPFRFLAGIFGGENDTLQTIAFEPGKNGLLPPEKEKLHNLSEALKNRPQLKLTVQGRYSSTDDGKALRSLSVHQALLASLNVKLESHEEPGPVDYADPRIQHALKKMFVEKLGELKFQEIEDSMTRHEHSRKMEEADKTRKDERLAMELYAKLMEIQNIPTSELKQLAESRAKSIVEELTEIGGISPNRITTRESEEREDREETSAKLELNIDVK
ncbi:DUF748 domain-containing protein [Desulforhabdus amnigena]|jgi:hypothetical protein|uniref:DUF748 domain-containing protein n=1 Tax=Desulforhabdus amnigena TaxID=40218 RepID=A0A9W6CZR0_9BACT|nr:DUF748 domain-containing protein [Desulforhabdus amnigena]GLI33307.1 hypothetical protein DAMNIGENAA_07400 [Desulforhabdus amnigena]